MQLTRFDRWLREKFVYETHIYTMRQLDAAETPRGVHCMPLAEKPGRRFRHVYITRNTAHADAVMTRLRSHGMMFTTRIEDRKAWYVRYLAPKFHSPTWWLFSMAVILLSCVSLIYGAMRLWANPEIRENLIESLQIMRG